MGNLADVLIRTAAEHGGRTAIKLDDLELPYAGIEGASRHAAGLLAGKGVSRATASG